MSDFSDDSAEKPLDPASERLRRKLMRLLAISVATLMLGVMAVLAAIVYKLNDRRPDAGAQPIVIALPAGTQIVGTAISGRDALLTLGPESPDRLLRIDLATGAIVARYRLSPP